MNLEQLRGFTTLASVGHFTRAAEQLHLSQPSLSRQISTLEDELHQSLFNRARGNLTLTAAGEALLPMARRMLAEQENVQRTMAELAGLRRGRVRLGAPPSLSVSLVADMFASFHAAYPGIELHLREAGSRILLDELAGGQLDLALIVTSEHPVPEQLEHVPLLEEELVVAGASPLPAQLDLRTLAGMELIQFSRGYDLRTSAQNAFATAGLVPRVVVEGAEMDAVLRFAARGLGVALVPATVVGPGLHSTPLAEKLSRRVGLAWRRDVPPSKAAAAMQADIIATARQLAAGHGQIRAL